MPSLAQRLSLLSNEPPSAVASILLGTLATARDEDELQLIAAKLLATRHPAAIAGVVRILHRLGDGGRALVERSRCDLAAGLLRVLDQPRARAALNALEVLDIRREPRLLQYALPLLESRAEGVPSAAAATMRNVVMHHMDRRGENLTSRDWLALDDAVADAMESWRHHRQSDVLLAGAALTIRPGPRMRAILSEEDHPASFAMRSVVERTDEPIVRRHMLRWLMHEPLNRQVMRWLHRVEGEEQFADVLSEGWLLLLPRVRRALPRVDRGGHFLPQPREAARLPEAVQRELPALPGLLGLSSQRRVEFLRDLRSIPSAVARIKAVVELGGFTGAEALATAAEFVGDEHASVAGLACATILQRTGGDISETSNAPMLKSLERSPLLRVAGRARHRLAARSVEAFFARWTALDDDARAALAAKLLASDRKSFIETLAHLAQDHDVETAGHAIALARRLRLVPAIEAQLLQCAQREEGRVASAAAKALADGERPERLDVLCDVLEHTDRRVRANAVEALAAISRRGEHRFSPTRAAPWLAQLAGHDENRLRGNALLALLRSRHAQGHEQLRIMLHDDRPLHRATAIWVARTGRAGQLAGDLRRLEHEDALPEIRTRAATARRWLRADDGVGRPHEPEALVMAP